jgi:hypothetical protein
MIAKIPNSNKPKAKSSRSAPNGKENFKKTNERKSY